MISDLTFITNEKNRNLLERFKVLIKDTRLFDVLVGYFYTSGFHALYKSLLIDYIGAAKKPIITEIHGGLQEKDDEDPPVWNFPAYKYKMEYKEDPYDSQKNHVKCTVWFADDNVSDPDYVGTQSFTQTYYYYIIGDKRNPNNGMWESASDGGWEGWEDSVEEHPDFMWYPGRATYHPVLNRDVIDEIIE